MTQCAWYIPGVVIDHREVKMAGINLSFPEDVRAALEAQAKKQGLKVEELCRRYVERGMVEDFYVNKYSSPLLIQVPGGVALFPTLSEQVIREFGR